MSDKLAISYIHQFHDKARYYGRSCRAYKENLRYLEVTELLDNCQNEEAAQFGTE